MKVSSAGQHQRKRRRINRLLDFSVDVYRKAEAFGAFAGQPETILTAGGSVYFDRVVERYRLAQLGPAVRVILRGGCSLTGM